MAWDLLVVVLDVVHNVRKIPLICDLQRVALSTLLCGDLNVLSVAVVDNGLWFLLENYTGLGPVYELCRGLLINKHLSMSLGEGRSVRPLFNLMSLDQLFGLILHSGSGADRVTRSISLLFKSELVMLFLLMLTVGSGVEFSGLVKQTVLYLRCLVIFR